MVGAINPASGQSIDTQIYAAITAKFQLSPGQTWPAEGSQPSTAAPPTSAKPNSTKGQRISGGAIAGIVIAILLVITLTAALVFFVRRSKQQTTPNGSEEVSTPLSRTKYDNEEVISIGMRYDPTSDSVQDGPVSPLEPPTRKKSVFRQFYRYPQTFFSEKPTVAPEGHPAFGPNSNQRTTVELAGDSTFGRVSR
jgi:hypothetical protein